MEVQVFQDCTNTQKKSIFLFQYKKVLNQNKCLIHMEM